MSDEELWQLYHDAEDEIVYRRPQAVHRGHEAGLRAVYNAGRGGSSFLSKTRGQIDLAALAAKDAYAAAAEAQSALPEDIPFDGMAMWRAAIQAAFAALTPTAETEAPTERELREQLAICLWSLDQADGVETESNLSKAARLLALPEFQPFRALAAASVDAGREREALALILDVAKGGGTGRMMKIADIARAALPAHQENSTHAS